VGRYVFQKRSTFYFVSKVPKSLQHHYTKNKIQICLHTDRESVALKQAALLRMQLEHQWTDLRLKHNESLFDCLLVTHHRAPTITEALDLYLSTKGDDRSEKFANTTKTNIYYLTKTAGNKPLDQYSSLDATKLRDWLIKTKKLKASSTRRVLTSIKSVMNLSISELGLDIKNPFTSVYIPPNEQSSRSSLTIKDLRQLQQLCLQANDEQRLIIALLSDTGLRLSEALGLVASDIDLTSPTPSLTIRSHPWRSLKTTSSTRVVPLVGVSLVAAQRAIEQTSSQFLFPNFASNTKTKSNMASAKLNQWLKKKLNNVYVIHSLRHTFRDRLRATQCPNEMINELGGWTKSTVGESYGDGYPLKLKYEQMMKITDVENYV